MNLAKVYCLVHGARATFDKAQHGISEQRTPGARELFGAFLRAFPSTPASPNNFDEFMQVLRGTGIGVAPINLPLPVLLPQIVPGHRLWAQGAKKSERFIALHDIQLWHDPVTKMMWANLYFVADDLSRLNIAQQRLLDETGLAGRFRGVSMRGSI
jgi:hypothetical protein